MWKGWGWLNRSRAEGCVSQRLRLVWIYLEPGRPRQLAGWIHPPSLATCVAWLPVDGVGLESVRWKG